MVVKVAIRNYKVKFLFNIVPTKKNISTVYLFTLYLLHPNAIAMVKQNYLEKAALFIRGKRTGFWQFINALIYTVLIKTKILDIS